MIERQILVDNLNCDEIRSKFLVTSQRKKLWNVECNLLVELDRICQKHDIRYFAFFGTLLGAARHGGFVPWDDDVDVIMFRPDFEKFKEVVRTEVAEPYFVDGWYDYKIELEEPPPANSSFQQLVKCGQRKIHPLWWPFRPMIKFKDSRTAFIQYTDRPHVHQGIFIDIFPFDPLLPFTDEQQSINYELEREMLVAIALPDKIKEEAKDKKLLMSDLELENFLKLSHHEKAIALESFALKNFSRSGFVGCLYDHCLGNNPKWSFAWDDFKQTVYLPFEKIELPCPIGYENILKKTYGDWRKQVISQSHATIYSADFSYRHYFATMRLK